jgi:hypothetical protein
MTVPQGDGQLPGLPSFPAAPPVYLDPRQTLPRPVEVSRSVLMWGLAAVSWLLANVLGTSLHSAIAVSFRSTTTRSVQDPDTGIVRSTTEAHQTGSGFVIEALVVIVVLWAVLIVLLQNGVNWARVTLTILGVLGSVELLADIVAVLGGGRAQNAGTDVQTALSVLVLLAVTVAMVAMYRRNANWYFRRS